MTFSPHIRRRCCPRVSPSVVPRKPIYVRKAGYSRYRVRRFSPPRLFPSCDKGIVGSECACRVFSTGECRVVPRVLRPDLPDPDVFLFSIKVKNPPGIPSQHTVSYIIVYSIHRTPTHPPPCISTPSSPLIKVLRELEQTISFSKATAPRSPRSPASPPERPHLHQIDGG